MTKRPDKTVDRQWLNTNFPCMMACPAHTNAGRYVALIAEGGFEEAYRFARDPNPLASICGRVCAHPCETACRRGEIDKPIQIRALKRFLTERHGPESRNFKPTETSEQPKLPYKVAIVGAGPVGLSAAHDLALMGYSVTIFEAAPVAGGMLYLGIPEYRLPHAVVEAQVREILSMGDVTLKLNQRAGRDFAVDELRSQGFDAVLIAVGAHRSRDLQIPGNDLDGVIKGIDFLLNVNLGYKFTIGKKVVVIGGGNVAMDVARSAAREVVRQHEAPTDTWAQNVRAVATKEMMDVSLSALRLGASEVHIVCIERRDEMPAAMEEIVEAEEEGITIHAGFGPHRIVGADGKVASLEMLTTQRVFDDQGRVNPQFVAGSESLVDCDTVILAIGQSANLDFLAGSGVAISPRGLITVEPGNLMTSQPGIFAGGDCVFGPRLIIDSVADGKRAAVGIDEFIRKQPHLAPIIEVEVLSRHQMITGYMEISRQAVPMLPLDRRTGMTEVEVGFDEQTAMAEAQRCLRCFINTVFEGTEVDGTECILCGGCVDVCPEQCLQLVPLEQFEFSEPVVAHLAQGGPQYEVELRGIEAAELTAGAALGSVMVKDETRCIRCGLCALRCPVGEIRMEAFHFKSADPTGLIPIQSFDLRSDQ
ncbi:MAG TPA: FAD-dependent oxidoreductase [Candidatus Saccharimonadales bacterium]|jgi:formate dehydrogenase beta subunit|nr:FAD-dependent oxidoreductase [Candidatus Saccharimonadales bacterium]